MPKHQHKLNEKRTNIIKIYKTCTKIYERSSNKNFVRNGKEIKVPITPGIYLLRPWSLKQICPFSPEEPANQKSNHIYMWVIEIG